MTVYSTTDVFRAMSLISASIRSEKVNPGEGLLIFPLPPPLLYRLSPRVASPANPSLC